FLFHASATPPSYTLSLHDALPISILDVLIAIFGGLGLIVAKTKSGTIASVIFGVAIATALMPPLCTVGYGLAVGNASYAGGALRSEEHTSELQSRENLVCRLLLEK